MYHLTARGRTTFAHAPETQTLFNNLREEASKIGMRVNDNKTQLLCISPSTNNCKSYLVTDDGTRLESSQTLKLLGFLFSDHPSPGAQVDAVVSKFRTRLWSLRYLKKSGLGEKDLCRAYTMYLRPVLEYGSVAIHSMLSQEQSDLLDKQQVRALKIAYGFHLSSYQVQEMSGLETLSLRRSKAVDRFALRLVDNPAFVHLFPLRPDDRRRSRVSHKYLEGHANTSRLFNSPVFYMRRRLNALENLPTERLLTGARAQTQRCDFLYDEWR